MYSPGTLPFYGRLHAVTQEPSALGYLDARNPSVETLSTALASAANRYGQPISRRGVRKLVAKCVKAGGVTKKASCHSLRHTFATYKAERGVPAYRLKEWLGHRNLNTTQIYVHLGRQDARKVTEATSL